ncbi:MULTISPECIES: ATP-binding cassette domain-containing protein [Saccharibacillus]|uniref:ATP-binding cassette domain-containing protein n=1 Tax=Saccharibacillus TaxID=456492 RepID=UPI00123A6986|nr:ATP-binding cassette domain-containing protein [Saccharibacillus sp. WB 17]
MISVKNVSINFKIANDRITTLKEFLLKKSTGKLEYKEFKALKNVSFDIKQGEVIGIVGSNGAGKSTLLKVISGILFPSSGSLKVDGTIAPMLELGAGFDVDLTAKENVFLNGSVLGYSKAYLTDKYEEIVEFSELQGFMDTPIRNFSSGMTMRLAFSIATLVNPDILIVDEILSVGDSKFQKKSAKRMRELMSGGTTVLMVSHSIEQIRAMCDRVVWLDHGEVQMVGKATDVCDAYMGKSKQEYLEEEQKQVSAHNQEASNEWKKNLYSPTRIEKINNEYFIVDCWHNRIIFNDNLSDPVEGWSVMAENIGDPHSIVSNGEIYLTEDTKADELRVFTREDNQFIQTKMIDKIGLRPNHIVYEENQNMFYGISAMSQHVFMLKDLEKDVSEEKVIKLGYLKKNSYIRSIRIIDHKLHFTSGPGKIIVADHIHSPFEKVQEYEVPFEISGMNDILKVDGYYYITVYQDGEGTVKPAFLRTKSLSSLKEGKYEELYEKLELKGIPYGLSFIDGRIFLTTIDSYSSIVSFCANEDKIEDLKIHYDVGPPDEHSIRKRTGN